MQFLTDFADQAVMLPTVGLIALLLLLIGWWRGAVAWMIVVAASFGLTALLKLGFAACGSPLPQDLLRSPSGHTMAGTVVGGGLLALSGLNPFASIGAAFAVAAVIGWSRVALGDHTAVEVAVGGMIGISSVPTLHGLLRPHACRFQSWFTLRTLLLASALLVPAALFHGCKLQLEGLIGDAARNYVGSTLGCKAAARPAADLLGMRVPVAEPNAPG